MISVQTINDALTDWMRVRARAPFGAILGHDPDRDGFLLRVFIREKPKQVAYVPVDVDLHDDGPEVFGPIADGVAKGIRLLAPDLPSHATESPIATGTYR